MGIAVDLPWLAQEMASDPAAPGLSHDALRDMSEKLVMSGLFYRIAANRLRDGDEVERPVAAPAILRPNIEQHAQRDGIEV